jgi:hypothetical protein
MCTSERLSYKMCLRDKFCRQFLDFECLDYVLRHEHLSEQGHCVMVGDSLEVL